MLRGTVVSEDFLGNCTHVGNSKFGIFHSVNGEDVCGHGLSRQSNQICFVLSSPQDRDSNPFVGFDLIESPQRPWALFLRQQRASLDSFLPVSK